jgi:hypothetical protein
MEDAGDGQCGLAAHDGLHLKNVGTVSNTIKSLIPVLLAVNR